MTTRICALAAAVLFLFSVGTSAEADTITYVATLTGPNQNPPNASPGTGYAEVLIDTVAHTMEIDASFDGLVGNTTAAHIHCCTVPPGNVGVATQTPSFLGFPLGVTAGTYSQVFDLTLASSYNPTFVTNHGGTVSTAEAALLAGLASGSAYFNIHTTVFPGGEIRGFLTVPDPGSSLLLLGIGLVSLRAWRKRLG
jgi:hypothetical protein